MNFLCGKSLRIQSSSANTYCINSGAIHDFKFFTKSIYFQILHFKYVNYRIAQFSGLIFNTELRIHKY